MFRSNFVYPCSALQVIAEMFLPLFTIFALAEAGVHNIVIVIFADTFEFQTKHFFVSQFPIFYSQQILAACVVITIDTVIVKTMLLMLVSYAMNTQDTQSLEVLHIGHNGGHPEK